ncbi:STAS domain-containing protein [Candidatus Electrothrix communis]|uniref:STAS domain-containing protein n=1 Tax=Candidatus Electrothrix communis TaxID=1859133 RepID=A0A3S3RBG9_9BACT|nr:STAS domain-containing protein [Desulfobulbus sp. US4]RWX48788.1 STAS domain-containing protein [Candidatus Electrothrix communis]
MCAPAFILYVKKNGGAERQAVILDLSLVEFMDSSGVIAIVFMFKSLNSKVSPKFLLSEQILPKKYYTSGRCSIQYVVGLFFAMPFFFKVQKG